MTDLGQQRREDLARLQLALRTLWPDRPVVYFTESADQSLGEGPVLTDEERQQLHRVAEAIRDAQEAGREEVRSCARQ